MLFFRIFLVAITAALVVYTFIVGQSHGWNLLPLFFADIFAMNWAGQFNLDFMCFLALSGLWVAWRYHFSAGGLVLSLGAFFGGILFLAPYLVYLTVQNDGDMLKVFAGSQRA